jgi:hypothetical protein
MLDTGFLSFPQNSSIIVQSLFSNIQNTFTYEFWVKPEAVHQIDIESISGTSGTYGQRYVIGPGYGGRGDQAGTGVSVGINGVSVYEHTANYMPAVLVYQTPIMDWTHVVIVYRNKTPSLYINGEWKKTGLSSPMHTVFASGVFGALETYGSFIGHLADLRIWDHARTEIQIKENMNRELTGNESGLFGYWKFKRERSSTSENAKNNEPLSIIIDHLDILYRYKILDRNTNLESLPKSSTKKTPIKKDLNSTQYLTDVLMFLGPFKDLENFFYPVANHLVKRGKSVALFTHKKECSDTSAFPPEVKVIFSENLSVNSNIHVIANNQYKTLLPSIDKWCKKMNLNTSQEQWLKQFFYQYAVDKITTLRLLELVSPKCVYGIHYILNPGCLGAFESFKSKTPIKNILIQHGFFGMNNNKYHDFKGADLVILWGNFHQRILEKMDDVSPSVVIGNPKLEALIQKMADVSGFKSEVRQTGGPTRILYIVSDSPKQNKATKENLDFFIRAATKLQNVNIIYKLHPSNSIMDFADYLNSRRITQDQMINDQDTYHLIHHSDIVVGDFSTGVFEAAALQKPVIQLYQPDQDKSHLKLKHAATETELIEVINQLRFNSQFYKHFISDQNKVIEELFHKIQGSAERIAEYICKLL